VDLKAALDFAREKGIGALQGLGFAARGELLGKMAALIHERRDDLIATAVRNSGSTRGGAKFDVDGASGTLAAYAELGKELGDRTRLDLIGQQNALFDALRALGKPLVICAINGRPPSWPNVVANANAILECWYPGQEGGTAMAEALFGRVNPGAKLPVSVVRDEGHLPFFYNHKPSARRGYLFADVAPLFPFGWGLSYTTFELGPPRPSATRVGAGETVEVTVTARNTGDRAGDEVVQLYLRDRVASVTRPVRQLRGFERVTLAPGERRTVTFLLGPADFTLFDDSMREVIEPGVFTIMTGPDSANLQSVDIEII